MPQLLSRAPCPSPSKTALAQSAEVVTGSSKTRKFLGSLRVLIIDHLSGMSGGHSHLNIKYQISSNPRTPPHFTNCRPNVFFPRYLLHQASRHIKLFVHLFFRLALQWKARAPFITSYLHLQIRSWQIIQYRFPFPCQAFTDNTIQIPLMIKSNVRDVKVL